MATNGLRFHVENSQVVNTARTTAASAWQTISMYVFNRRRLSINLVMYVLHGIHKA